VWRSGSCSLGLRSAQMRLGEPFADPEDILVGVGVVRHNIFAGSACSLEDFGDRLAVAGQLVARGLDTLISR